MTVWLRRQEAVYKFGTYLQWAVPGYIAQTESGTVYVDNGEDRDDEDPEDASRSVPASSKMPDDDESDDELEDSPDAELSTLVYHFAAPYNLDDFPQSKAIIPRTEAIDNSTFPVHKRLSVHLPKIIEITSHDAQYEVGHCG
ncbi:hypothetical protein GGX14DRAFT_572870 [Mycena pura]|uniref:Uncharacterized protein n=1 Tax=Mycena pura TaxID=153505 RepID=A0AAD6V0D2_9AGAR|nr:hypothetical protein GGX14DRAFT_572870 [Mycena pura]